MEKQIAILGIPFDDNSSFLKGAGEGPKAILEAYHSLSANYFTESGLDLEGIPGLHEAGDLSITEYLSDIESGLKDLLRGGNQVISLGGDHSISYPILRAYSEHYPGIHLLQIDAHPDLYPDYKGNRHSHACPFARILEEKLVMTLTQLGVRTMTTAQRQVVDKYQVEVWDMNRWSPGQPLKLQGPLYLSIDLDALDPAFAPGVSHHEPGGLSTREVLEVIQAIEVPIVGADIVELNPRRDLNNMTAMVAAKILREVIDKMLGNRG